MAVGGEGCFDDGVQPMAVTEPCFLVYSVTVLTVRALWGKSSFPLLSHREATLLSLTPVSIQSRPSRHPLSVPVLVFQPTVIQGCQLG